MAQRQALKTWAYSPEAGMTVLLILLGGVATVGFGVWWFFSWPGVCVYLAALVAGSFALYKHSERHWRM